MGASFRTDHAASTTTAANPGPGAAGGLAGELPDVLVLSGVVVVLCELVVVLSGVVVVLCEVVVVLSGVVVPPPPDAATSCWVTVGVVVVE